MPLLNPGDFQIEFEVTEKNKSMLYGIENPLESIRRVDSIKKKVEKLDINAKEFFPKNLIKK